MIDLADMARRLWCRLKPFRSSQAYWENRYSVGGTSGTGSFGRLAQFKADVLNGFVIRHQIRSIIEFGCGDGNQLKLANYPHYLGFDVSPTAISMCQRVFAGDQTKEFRLMREYRGEKAELTLSLDVLYHLVEDPIFVNYLKTLFGASNNFVIVYSSNTNRNLRFIGGPHVRNRRFTDWIERALPAWKLVEHLPSKYAGSPADFFIYAKA